MAIFFISPGEGGGNIMGKDTTRREEMKSFYASYPLEILIGRRGGGVIKKCRGGGVGTLRSETD